MLILASASPRRREILSLTGIPFIVAPADADETLPHGLPPETAACVIAARKAASAAEKYLTDTVIGADTVVVSPFGEIYGKPYDNAAAARMLFSYSGAWHCVITGVAIVKDGLTETFYESTRVKFRTVTEDEILSYIATGEPADKAGAYAVQGAASMFVERIEGNYSNIVGLPLCELCRRLNIRL